MGADYYDYILADLNIIPRENQKFYTEKIAYLSSYQANDSKRIRPDIFFNRKDLGLPESGFIFCCFNNTYKLTPETFDSWSRILKKAKDSILLIYVDNEVAKKNLRKEISNRGINSSRLFFGERLPESEYLARYRVADLFLDTHPYNAGTTASDALWMGLPVLTLCGNSFPSRMASSLLNALKIPELITLNQNDYESLAIELAIEPKKLKLIKDKLDNNISTAPLFDSQKFIKSLESVYCKMYDRRFNGLTPDHIYD
jgi:predicted O-linked N-acetylglucosamine transferase (SPINDLY family)